MIGHERQILSALGIDLWIPRAESCQNYQPTSIWRDQVTDEIVTTLNVPIAPVIPVQASSELVHPLRKNDSRVTAQQLEVIEAIDAAPIQNLAAFQLQSLCLAHCVIVVDVTTISAEQQQLWSNIQRAVSASFSELNWPCIWSELQDARGAVCYVNGFIDVQSVDRSIVLLGLVPLVQYPQAIQLPSLQDMLDQPSLKRELWQLMQSQQMNA